MLGCAHPAQCSCRPSHGRCSFAAGRPQDAALWGPGCWTRPQHCGRLPRGTPSLVGGRLWPPRAAKSIPGEDKSRPLCHCRVPLGQSWLVPGLQLRVASPGRPLGVLGMWRAQGSEGQALGQPAFYITLITRHCVAEMSKFEIAVVLLETSRAAAGPVLGGPSCAAVNYTRPGKDSDTMSWPHPVSVGSVQGAQGGWHGLAFRVTPLPDCRSLCRAHLLPQEEPSAAACSCLSLPTPCPASGQRGRQD